MQQIQATWEFEEWYNDTCFWCEMEESLNITLENATKEGVWNYTLQTSLNDQYTWDFINMMQYHDFWDYNNRPRQTSRRIRRCHILHAPWTRDPRKKESPAISLQQPELVPGWNCSPPIWEFEEQYEEKQYWAAMDSKYVEKLEDAYNYKDMIEYEMYDENCWYEWHLDIMTQYRYFYNKWNKLRRTSRSIRKIVLLHIAFNPEAKLSNRQKKILPPTCLH